MGKNTIRYITLLGAISIIGIIVIQIYWVRKAFDLKEKQFDQTIEIALRNVAGEMAQYGQFTLPSTDLINKISTDYYAVNLNNSINAKTLQYYLINEFERVGINTDFEYGIYDCSSDKMVYGNYVSSKATVGNARIISLPKMDKLTYYFVIYFPERSSYVMLPEMDGFTLAREIRKINSDTPIIFLTAKTMKEDKITGFQTGADDYITKPFSIEELILRIEVFLKRSTKAGVQKDEPSVFEIGKYHFNFQTLTLLDGEEKHTLTMKEAELLKFFCMNRDKILKREEILRAIWGDDDYFMGRSLDVFISRLRKLLQNDVHIHIENTHGIGFRLSIDK